MTTQPGPGEALVRAATPDDAAAVAAVYRPYVTGTAVSFEDVPPDAAEVARRMAQPPLLPWLVAEVPGAGVVGYACATAHRARPAYRWSVDCSVYLDQRHRGRGLGRALYRVLLPLLADLGHHRAHAGIALPNPASVALHESFGFRPVGVFAQVGHKQGAWHDVGWWQLVLAEPAEPPAEPRPYRRD